MMVTCVGIFQKGVWSEFVSPLNQIQYGLVWGNLTAARNLNIFKTWSASWPPCDQSRPKTLLVFVSFHVTTVCGQTYRISNDKAEAAFQKSSSPSRGGSAMATTRAKKATRKRDIRRRIVNKFYQLKGLTFRLIITITRAFCGS